MERRRELFRIAGILTLLMSTISLITISAMQLGSPGTAGAAVVTPTPFAGNLNCPAGYLELRIQSPTSTTYTTTDGAFSVRLVVRQTTEGQVFDFFASQGVSLVFVKAGPGGNVYNYEPNEVTTDTGLHGQVNPANNTYYGLSHLSFCYDNDPTPTPTNTPTKTPTPPPTPTNTPTNTPTDTPTNTPTNTPTDTPTNTPTNTPTDTPTNTPTDTPTNTPTDTPTNTPTNTPVPPTDTPTNTPTNTPVPPTDTPTPSPTVAIVTEVPVTGGCTPGYWKQPQHLDSWAATGYTPGTTLESVFDVPDSFGLDNDTLHTALSYEGDSTKKGAAKILLRAAVAALLNSAHPDVDYPLSTAEVIAQVNAALGGNRSGMTSLANLLDQYNNRGCTLS